MRTECNNNMCFKRIINWFGLLKWANQVQRVWLFHTSLLLVVIVLGGLHFSSCTSIRTVPKGWSGGTIAGDSLVIGSTDGELVAVNMIDGTRLWDAKLQSPTTSGGFGCASAASSAVAIYGSPAVTGNITYVGGYNGIVYAYKIGKEEPAWLYPRQGYLGGSIVGGLVVSQDSLYFGCADGKVYALEIEAEGLYQKWVFETGDKIWSTPTIDGDTLYIGSFDKKLYAIDTETGEAKWEKPFEAEGVIITTPVVYNSTVYVGSFDRHLYAVDAADGSFRWKFMAQNWFWAKPIIYDNLIYAPCLDGRVYILDADSGDEIDRLELGSPVSSSPVLAGNLLVVATEEGVVYAIDIGTNRVKWSNDDLKGEKHKVYAPLCIGGGRVYIHTHKGELRALDVQSGVEQWSIPLKSS